MNKLVLLLALLYSFPGQAFELRPASLDHLSLDVAKFGCNREVMTPDIPCDQYRGRVRLNWDVGLFNDLIKWRNEIHTEGTREKLTTVGWHYMLALPLFGGLEAFVEHHSRHVMDAQQPTMLGDTRPERYPVEDSIGLRITIFERNKK